MESSFLLPKTMIVQETNLSVLMSKVKLLFRFIWVKCIFLEKCRYVIVMYELYKRNHLLLLDSLDASFP